MKYAVLAIALGACAKSAPAPANEPPAEAGATPAYRFAWNAPCAVPVTETYVGGGNLAEVSDVVHVAPTTAGKLAVYRDQVRATRINGRPVTTASPAEQRSVEGLVALPTLEITSEGHFVGIPDFTAYEDLMVQVFVDSHDEGARDYARDAMAQPSMREMITSLAANAWATWVEAWIDWKVAAGDQLDVKGDDGELIRREHLGMSNQRVHLKMTTTFATGAVLVAETEIDPATLRPTWARSTDPTGITREIRFDWAHATGCK